MPDDEGKPGETDPKGDGKPTDPPRGSDSKGDGKSDTDGGGDSGRNVPQEIKEFVEGKFNELKELITGTGGVTKKEGGEGEPTNRASVEAAAERLVQDAAAKLQAERQHEEDHAKLHQKEPEKPPVKQSRAQRWLWGNMDDDK